jgi:lon-related putative ATP-dependent protease
MAIGKISPAEACSRCALELFSFETTDGITQPVGFAGQGRAFEAVAFGVGIHHRGFNLFVTGPEGSGRHEMTQAVVREKALAEPAPSEWCYVNNFKRPHLPRAFSFPSGQSSVFKKEMSALIIALKSTLPAVVEADDFKEKIKTVNEALRQNIDTLIHEVEAKANADSIALVKSEEGIMLTPMDGNRKPLDQAAFQHLPLETRKNLEEVVAKHQNALQDAVSRIAVLKKEAEEFRAKLKNDFVSQAVNSMINPLKTKYDKRSDVLGYLQDVADDIIIHADEFLYKADGDREILTRVFTVPTPSFERYEVNILVGNHTTGAPVIFEDMPTYQKLHGRIEHVARMGMLTTHFTLIKPGALHQANGGYLILDARRLLMQPYAYEGLKRSLRSGQIRIEPLDRLLGLMSTVTLEPEPIPLETKIILVGDTLLYYLLRYYDPEFHTFFKVQADFEQNMDRSPENINLFTSLLATMIAREKLLPMNRKAVAGLIEYSARAAGDGTKLSLAMEDLADVMKEADYIARQQDKTLTEAEDVTAALAARKRRGGRIRDTLFEAIRRGLRHIETAGERVGQVNGLSVIVLNSDSFGVPTRITARTRPGKGEVLDIEREVELGGPLHSKGVLILDAFLSSRYAREVPLSLRASLVFEQSYGGVEGDSASCAELCALLSSLADTPIHQAIAITGSISQQGEIQAIGGVNEKVEGFFDLCAARGLSGKEGVIIPAANVAHLMLKNEVVEAIAAQQFHLWSVTTVDEAISLLTSLPAGERDDDGEYPEESVNGRVEATLRSFAVTIQMFEKKEFKEEQLPESTPTDDVAARQSDRK